MIYRVATSGCYEWQGCLNNGRPCVKIAGRMHYVSRAIYATAFGRIAAGLFVRHRCDNPVCVRLDHLELGTCQDNHDDQLSRGRTLRGQNNPTARLTEDGVLYIRSHPEKTTRELERELGCPYKTIYGVRSNRTWKHLLKEPTND